MSGGITQSDADSHCQVTYDGGHLVWIESAAEESWIASLTPSGVRYWIGLVKSLDDTLSWLSGHSVAYTDPWNGSGLGHCFVGKNADWFPNYCANTETQFICKQKITCFGLAVEDACNVASGAGECVSLDVCDCAQDYTGQECEVIDCYGILSNDSSVCTGHGTCSAPHTCDCVSDYYGLSCALPKCYGYELDACSGNGICMDVDDCYCPEYDGLQCQYPICSSRASNDPSVCSGQGNCTAPETCVCEADYSGMDCEHFPCFSILSNETEVCSGHGVCQSPNSCNCASGYSGQNCELSICFSISSNETSVCSSHGNCVSPDVCNCTLGYTGPECDSKICYGVNSSNTSVCSGRGVCEAPDTCDCAVGYFGQNCELHYCFGTLYNQSSVCSGNGTCNLPDNCLCNPGYFGQQCEIISCFGVLSNSSSVCSSNGNCTSSDYCDCFHGYGGHNCQLNNCFGFMSNDSSVCSSYGDCIAPNSCNCDAGYGSPDCSTPICFGILGNESNVCSSQGNCSAPDFCQCELHYGGDSCELKYCYGILSNDSAVCSSRGSCTNVDTCSCEIGYGGANCELNNCFEILSNDSSVCSSHGDCIAPNSCNCDTGYGSPDCSTPICFGILGNESNVCSSQGNCSTPDVCLCDDGFGGTMCEYHTCFTIPSNETTIVCSGQGSCNDTDLCICNDGYGGESCGLNYCFGILSNESSVCSGNGTCNLPDNCLCNLGYGGESCELNYCFGLLSNYSSVCSSHGDCIAPNSCDCDTGYDSPDCSTPICFGILGNESNVCSSFGNCSAPDLCTCNSGHVGYNCQWNLCYGIWSNDSSVCHGHNSSCIAPDNCVCSSGYAGEECQWNVCYDVWSNDSSVCDTHGSCDSPNNCTCSDGYAGENCQWNVCYDVWSNDSSVCSGHDSSCVAPDNCTCIEGYAGENCQWNVCYDIWSNDSSVCSGHGSCDSPNNCTCSDGYAGENCQWNICYNIWSNDSAVCSNGRGTCPSPDFCLCDNGFIGETCQWNLCFDIWSNSSNVCSGHGTCEAPQVCSCEKSFMGSQCQVKIVQSFACSNNSSGTEYNSCFGYQNIDHRVCSSHGTCTGLNQCECDMDYTGNSCQFWMKDPKAVNGTAELITQYSGSLFMDSCDVLYILDAKQNVLTSSQSPSIFSVVYGSPNDTGYRDDRLLFARFSMPVDLTENSFGHFLVADKGNNRLRYVNRFTGTVQTYSQHIFQNISCVVMGEWNDAYVCSGSGIFRLPYSVNNRNMSLQMLASPDESGYRESLGTNLIPLFGRASDLEFNHLKTRLFVADSENHVIRVCLAVELHDQYCLSTLVAGIPQQSGFRDGSIQGEALFSHPQYIVQAKHNDFIYVSERGNEAIRVIDLRTKLVRTVAGSSSYSASSWEQSMFVSSLSFSQIGRIMEHNTDLYVSDDRGVWKLSHALHIHQQLFDSPRSNANATSCFGFAQTDHNACSGNGNCTDLDTCTCYSGYLGSQCEKSHSFQHCDSTTFSFLNDGSKGSRAGEARSIRRIFVDENGDVYASDFQAHHVKHYRKSDSAGSRYSVSIIVGSGAFSDSPKDFGATKVANWTHFRHPLSVIRSESDRSLLISDTENLALKELFLSTENMSTGRVASNVSSQLLFDDSSIGTIQVSTGWPFTLEHSVYSNGSFPFNCSTVFDNHWPQNHTQFDTIMGVAVDSENGLIYVSDSGHHVIQALSFHAIKETDERCNSSVFAGTWMQPGMRDGQLLYAQFHHPHGLLLRNGFLLVADTFNARIRKINIRTQTVSSLFDGQVCHHCSLFEKGLLIDEPISNLHLSQPYDIIVHENSLFISDIGLNRIVEVQYKMNESCGCSTWSAFTADCECSEGFYGDRCSFKRKYCSGHDPVKEDACFSSIDAGTCAFEDTCVCSSNRTGSQCEFNHCVHNDTQVLDIENSLFKDHNSSMVNIQIPGARTIIPVDSSTLYVFDVANNVVLNVSLNGSNIQSVNKITEWIFPSKIIEMDVHQKQVLYTLQDYPFIVRRHVFGEKNHQNMTLGFSVVSMSVSQIHSEVVYFLTTNSSLVLCNFTSESCSLLTNGKIGVWTDASVILAQQNAQQQEDELFIVVNSNSSIILCSPQGDVHNFSMGSSTLASRDGKRETYAAFGKIRSLSRGDFSATFPARLFLLDQNGLWRVILNDFNRVITLATLHDGANGFVESISVAPNSFYYTAFFASENQTRLSMFSLSIDSSCHCTSDSWTPFSNSCQCTSSEYLGDFCEEVLPAYSCFKTHWADESVCSGHGSCTNEDNCDCWDSSQWTGLNCHIPVCYDYSADEAEVCSSHGACVSNQTCHCMEGYVPPSCEPCGKGRYWVSGNDTQPFCEKCPKGTASEQQVATSPVSCIPCMRNYYADAEGLFSCFACPQGYYHAANLTGEIDDSNCVRAPLGTYISRGDLPIPCPKGTWLNDTGSSLQDCIECSRGSSSNTVGNSDMASCVPCEEGQYAPSQGMSQCIPCPLGYQKIENRTGSISLADACVPCPSGTGAKEVQPNLCVECLPGQYSKQILDTGGVICELCPLGTFAQYSHSASCTSCGNGQSTFGLGSTSIADCLVCSPGSYLKDSKQCEPCPLGTASAIYNATSFSDCVSCEPGFYTKEHGSTSCEICGEGKFSSDGTDCIQCPAGNFSESASSTQCASCMVGSWSYPGSTFCTECPVGYYGDSLVPQSNNDHCKQCPPSTIAEAGSAECSTCPSGSYPSSDQSKCIPCPRGTSAKSSHIESEKDCIPCPKGSFSTISGASDPLEELCVPCGPGYYSDIEGSSFNSCIPCPVGTASNRTGAGSAAECKLCPRGFFSNHPASSHCSPCVTAAQCPNMGSSTVLPEFVAAMSNSDFSDFPLIRSALSVYDPLLSLDDLNLSWILVRYLSIAFISLSVFMIIFLVFSFGLCIYGKRNLFLPIRKMDMLFSLRRRFEVDETVMKRQTYCGGIITIVTVGVALILCLVTLSDFLFENVLVTEAFRLQSEDVTFRASGTFSASVYFFGSIPQCNLTESSASGVHAYINGYDGEYRMQCFEVQKFQGYEIEACKCEMTCPSCSLPVLIQTTSFSLPPEALVNTIAYEYGVPYYLSNKTYFVNGTVVARNGTAFYDDSSLVIDFDTYKSIYKSIQGFFYRIWSEFIPFSLNDENGSEYYSFGYKTVLRAASTAPQIEALKHTSRVNVTIRSEVNPFFFYYQERAKSTTLEFLFECFGLCSLVLSVFTFIIYGLYILDAKLTETIKQMRRKDRYTTKPDWIESGQYDEDTFVSGM